VKAFYHSLGNYGKETECDYRHAPMAHHLAGLSWTASGYGARIPTEHMVRIHGKWRRVYCRIFSNNGTLFIGRKYDGSWIIELRRD
jgi:hypothetical protein